MAFVGEESYRQALADAERHESIAAMVRLVGLKGALAEIESLRSKEQKWRPIETAPKDGSKVDLWVVWPEYNDDSAHARRAPDASWDADDWLIGQYKLGQFMAKPYATHWMPPPADPVIE